MTDFFHVNGRRYCYLQQNHPSTPQEHIGERSVEIPLARYWIEQLGPAARRRMIEIGAVMPYWIDRIQRNSQLDPCVATGVPWPVYDPVDPYAQAIKADAMTLRYQGHDVLSISTIEHIGRDDYDGAPQRTTQDATLLLDMIHATARNYFVCWPLGWNPTLDRHARARARQPQFGWRFILLRQVSSYNRWAQIEKPTPDDWAAPYGSPFPHGNVLAICTNHPMT